MWRLISVLVAALIARAPLGAQGPSTTHEFRIDALASRQTAIELGASVIVPSGVYARTAFTAASGITRHGSATSLAMRAEVISRFLLDPFRASPIGLSIGGGIGISNVAGGPGWRPYMAFVADLELKRAGALTPAIQLGLGGGVRAAVVLRSGTDRWR